MSRTTSIKRNRKEGRGVARRKTTRAAPKKKTRTQWAEEIVADYTKSVEAILKVGHTLIAAKKALEHGEFEQMIEHDLPFAASTAQRLMKIARDPRLQKAARGQLLPAAWRTLYELTQASDAAFEQAVSSGAIQPAMTRKQAISIKVPVTQRETPKRFVTVSPVYRASSAIGSGDDVSTDIAAALATQIERVVSELAMMIERGDVGTDDVFKSRMRAVADRILSFVKPQ